MSIGEALVHITFIAYEHYIITFIFLLAICPWNKVSAKYKKNSDKQE